MNHHRREIRRLIQHCAAGIHGVVLHTVYIRVTEYRHLRAVYRGNAYDVERFVLHSSGTQIGPEDPPRAIAKDEDGVLNAELVEPAPDAAVAGGLGEGVAGAKLEIRDRRPCQSSSHLMPIQRLAADSPQS
jgi:hypothetical protein